MRIKFDAVVSGAFLMEGHEKLPLGKRQWEYLQNVSCEVIAEAEGVADTLKIVDWNKKEVGK